MDDKLTGACSCGRVKFVVRGTPELVAACHCKDCRRHTGAPVAVYVDVLADRVEMRGAPIDWFETSPGAYRGFCGRCGATLAYRGSSRPAMLHVHVGAFDRPERLIPSRDEHVESRLPWLDAIAGRDRERPES